MGRLAVSLFIIQLPKAELVVLGVFADEVSMLKPVLSRNFASRIKNRRKFAFWAKMWSTCKI